MKKLVALLSVLVMCLSLCACGKAGKYEKALTLMDEKSYEEALDIFSDLEDYEDSAQKIWECQKAVALSSSFESADELVEALVTYFEGTGEDIAVLKANTSIHGFFQEDGEGVGIYRNLAEKITEKQTKADEARIAEIGEEAFWEECFSGEYLHVTPEERIYQIFDACNNTNWYWAIDTGTGPLGFWGKECMPTKNQIVGGIKRDFKNPDSVSITSAKLAVVSKVENGMYEMPMEYVIVADISATNSFGGTIVESYWMTGTSSGRFKLEGRSGLVGVSWGDIRYKGEYYPAYSLYY